MAYFRAGTARATHEAQQIDVAKTPLATFESNVSGLYIPKILAYIQATQSGTGDPSPSNPRAISGVSEVTTACNAVNQWDEVSEIGNINNSTGQNQDYGTNRIRSKNYISVYPSLEMCVVNSNTVPIYLYCYRRDKTYIGLYSSTGITGASTITIPSDCYFIRFRSNDNYGDTIGKISFNYPATDTAYHAYTGQTSTTALGGTYYGGYLNVTTGLLTVTWSDKFTIDGSVSVVSVAQSGGVYYISVRTNLTGVNTTSSNKTVISDKMKTSTGLVTDNRCYITNGGATLVCILSDQTITTKEQANQWFSDNPTTFCYKLATPQTVQLTPAQVTQLIGQNNVFCSSGDVAVKYWKID